MVVEEEEEEPVFRRLNTWPLIEEKQLGHALFALVYVGLLYIL